MEKGDVLIYAFLISFIASVAEFLIFGIIKLYELFVTNFTLFGALLIPPIIALSSFLILLFKL